MNAVKEEWGWRGHRGKASAVLTDSKKGINYQSQQILSLMFLKNVPMAPRFATSSLQVHIKER